MTFGEFRKLVKKYHGWLEGNVARFPSVWLREQFEKYATGK